MKAKKSFYGMIGMIILIILTLIVSSCCYSQIVSQLPDQVYFATDSCDYSMPDYTQVITVSDNCNVEYFYQYPESGFTLEPGNLYEVSIVAGDVTGNERTIKFNVMVVDTIPPVFDVDTVLFNSLSHYQNEIRTWRLYNWITAKGDTLQSPEGFGLWGYYTAQDIMNIADPKCEPEKMTFVAFEDLPDGHPLKPIPEPVIPIAIMDKNVDTTGIHINYWRSLESLKRQFFFAVDTYRISYVMLPIAKNGNPGNLIIELNEMSESDEVIQNISIGVYHASNVGPQEETHTWHYIPMSDAVLFESRKYCLHLRLEQASSTDNMIWWTNMGNPPQYLMYSYTGGEEWGYNHEGGYMFQIMGYPLHL